MSRVCRYLCSFDRTISMEIPRRGMPFGTVGDGRMMSQNDSSLARDGMRRGFTGAANANGG
jgi:hypothetical protein